MLRALATLLTQNLEFYQNQKLCGNLASDLAHSGGLVYVPFRHAYDSIEARRSGPLVSQCRALGERLWLDFLWRVPHRWHKSALVRGFSASEARR